MGGGKEEGGGGGGEVSCIVQHVVTLLTCTE